LQGDKAYTLFIDAKKCFLKESFKKTPLTRYYICSLRKVETVARRWCCDCGLGGDVKQSVGSRAEEPPFDWCLQASREPSSYRCKTSAQIGSVTNVLESITIDWEKIRFCDEIQYLYTNGNCLSHAVRTSIARVLENPSITRFWIDDFGLKSYNSSSYRLEINKKSKSSNPKSKIRRIKSQNTLGSGSTTLV
jgi:hypothetical protein